MILILATFLTCFFLWKHEVFLKTFRTYCEKYFSAILGFCGTVLGNQGGFKDIFVKLGRGELLESLAKVQIDSALLSGLESLSSVQTKGVKRQLAEEQQTYKFMQTEG